MEISNIAITNHDRYAHDQATLDPTILQNAAEISSHADLAATSSIYTSQLAELLQLTFGASTWAFFSPPPDYDKKSNRFFRSRLFPSKKTVEEELEIFEEVLMEMEEDRDKKALSDFKEEFSRLNQLSLEINALKSQYQKG